MICKKLILVSLKDSKQNENANRYAIAFELLRCKVSYEKINDKINPILTIDTFEEFLKINDMIHDMGYTYCIIPWDIEHYLLTINDKKEDE